MTREGRPALYFGAQPVIVAKDGRIPVTSIEADQFDDIDQFREAARHQDIYPICVSEEAWRKFELLISPLIDTEFEHAPKSA